jgi:precorrin-2 dehydrogenase
MPTKIAKKPAAILSERVFFPMLVNLAGRKCVVVGGGKIAAAKIHGLLACGASITVVSPRAVPAIQRLAHAGFLIWRRRSFSARDLNRAFLAIAATSSRAINSTVFRACASHCIFCNSVDDPEHCDFIYPAVVRRGPLQIAVSTSGHSPALASRLRRELERQFGPEWSDWVSQLGKRRDNLLRSKLPPKVRCQRLRKLAAPAAFQAFLRQRKAKSSQKRRRQTG